MKSCPKCDQTYSDDTLNFCLTDGSILTVLAEEPTAVIQRPANVKKGRALKWIVLVSLVAVAGLGIAATALIYRYYENADHSAGNTQTTPDRQVKTTNTPVTLASSTPSTSSDNQSSQKVNTASSPGIEENSDEVTPIGWDTTAGGFKGESGRTFKFQCPPNGTSHSVYGNDVYTDYSSICTAAVHVGLIDLEKGGEVTLEYRPGRQIYGSTVRNGIKSNTAGEYARSYVVR